MINIVSSDMIFDILTLVRRDGWTSFPSPEVIGFSGCVKWMGFNPVLPDVPFNHPSIVSNSICVGFINPGFLMDLLPSKSSAQADDVANNAQLLGRPKTLTTG